MKLSSILLTVVVLVLVISVLSIWFYPSAEDFMAHNKTWNGIRNFSSEFSADSIDSLDNFRYPAEETVLVAIPSLDYSDEELSTLKRFVHDGGFLLLMDDYGYGNSILAYLGVSARFTNKLLGDPLLSYNNSLPRITDFAPEVKESGVDIIMLNHATTLTDVADSEVIARSSPASFLDTNGNGTWEQIEPTGPFAVSAVLQLGEGTLAIISDPSIAINAMLDKDDNYNFIRYLMHYEGEQKRILIDSSHIFKAPLDVSKTKLIKSREMLSNPYSLLGITATVFIIVSGLTFKKGGNRG